MSISLETAARLAHFHRMDVDTVAPSRRTPYRKPRWILTGALLACVAFAIAYAMRGLI